MITRRTINAVLIASAIFGGGAAGVWADVVPPGDIPDNQAFVRFNGAGYSVKTPEGWGRTKHGQVVTFTHTFNGISVEIARSAKAPSVASVTHNDVAMLKRTARGFQLRAVSRVTRTAGPAILMTYRAASAPDAVTGKTVTQDVERYAFWKSGREAIITLEAPKGSDNVDAWRLVTNSFRWAG